MNILILGWAGSGKDEVAKLIASKANLNYFNVSFRAAEIFILDKLKDLYGYNNAVECYNDRTSKRETWAYLFHEYNKTNSVSFVEEMFKDGLNIYSGVRTRKDLSKVLHLVDYIIWVDSSIRITYENNEPSFDVSEECAHYTIDNNYSISNLEEEVDMLLEKIKKNSKGL